MSMARSILSIQNIESTFLNGKISIKIIQMLPDSVNLGFYAAIAYIKSKLVCLTSEKYKEIAPHQHLYTTTTTMINVSINQ